MIAAHKSALAAAFEQTHSPLFDLSEDAPSVAALAEYRTRPIDFFVEKMGIPRNRLVWSTNEGYLDESGKFTRVCPVCHGEPSDAKKPCPLCRGMRVVSWDGTPDPIAAACNALVENMHVSIESATGTGKSYLCALLVFWFLACWEGAIVKTFAPSEEQLRAYMWKEIGVLWPRFQAIFPTARLLDLEIRMRGGQDNSWGAVGVSVRIRAGQESAVGAQGMHAPHMLLIYEETPGIDMSVITAGIETCTADHNLRIAVGNPDHQLDTLHQFGHDKYGKPRARMRNIRISALDHPNVVCNDPEIVPGAVSRTSVEERLADRGAEDRLYQSRVRGLSPSEAADALIKLEWIRAAQERWADNDARAILERVGKGKRALGVDVANSEGGDLGAIAEGVGAVLEKVEAMPCPNANDFGFKVFLRMRDNGIDDEHVGVDGVGVGAGAVNELIRNDRYIRDIQSGGKAEGTPGDETETETFKDLRAQIQWTLREDLRKGVIALPPDEELAMDLITPTYKTKNGKIIVESKEDLSARLPGRRSPNKGDAAGYWNFVRPRGPVVSERPQNRALSTRERILKELEAMDGQPELSKRYYGVMRQG